MARPGNATGREPTSRLVFDLDVFVYAGLDPAGASGEIWRRVESGEFALLWTESLRRDVLSLLEQVRLEPHYRARVSSVFLPAYRVEGPPLSLYQRDPFFSEIVLCAVYGDGDAVITRDPSLLRLVRFQRTLFLTPEAFAQAHHHFDDSGRSDGG